LPARDVKKKVKAVLKQRYFYYLSPQMKQPIKEIMNIKPTAMIKLAMLLATSMAFHVTSQAQLATATWTGGGGDGEWNTALNWDQGLPPGDGTNAVVGAGNTVNYNLPMAAASFAGLNLGGSLDINTNLFNVDGGSTNSTPSAVASGAVLNINTNGVATIANLTNATTVTGALNVNAGGMLNFTNSSLLALAVGGVLNVPGGVFTMTNTVGSASLNIGPNGRNNGATATFTGATVNIDKQLNIQGGASSGTLVSSLTVLGGTLNCGVCRIQNSTDDIATRLVVDGGAVVNMSGLVSQRSGSTGGLILSNGVVTTASIQIGTAASKAYSTIYGGILTNTGSFTISDTTNAATSSDRRSQFLMRGGTVVSTGAAGIILGNQSNNGGTVANGNIGGVLDITSGTLTAEKLTLIRDATLTNAYARLQLSGSGAIYLGSGGLVANVGVANTAYAIVLSGGTLGAMADWSSTVPLPLSGTVTFKAADTANVGHNVTLSGRVSGTGVLNKTGTGMLTLAATNNYTANTVINAGTLALAATGSISNTAQITVAGGATFDVSAVTGASLMGSQTLSGSGSVTGGLTALSGAHIQPGGNTTAGTLTFSNDLSEADNVINNFDLSDDPTGISKTNDFLNILGSLTLSGTNTIQVNPLNGPLPVNSTYKVIQYGGSLNGVLTSLVVGGVTGILSNDVPSKTIWLVVPSATRASTSVTWMGSASSSDWDTQVSSNWLNVATAARDLFVTGDSVRFDDTGTTNPVVTLVGSVSPSATVVDTTSNYTFTGSGTLDGTGSLIKTNSGALTILTANNGYTGDTVIGGGTLAVSKLANGGLTSSIGSSSSDPTNLVFYSSTLSYLGGNASSDHGATLDGVTDTIEVTNSSMTLTMSGVLTGPAALVKAGRGVLTLSGNNSPASGTIISNGVLQLNAAGTGGTVGITNRGATLRLGSAFILLNVVDFEGNCTVDLNNAGGDSELNGAWSGSGNVTVINQQGSTARTLTVGGNGNGGGNLANFYGTLSMGTNIGFLRFNDGGGSPNLGSTNVAIDLGTGSATFLIRNGGVTVNFGSFAGGPNTKLSGRGSGTAATATYSVGGLNTSTLFAGSIVNGGNPTAITKVGTGVWTLSGTNTYTGATIISNGVLALSGFGSVSNTPTISVLTNTFLDVSARTDGTLTLNTNQTLQGSGTIHGSVTAPASSTLTVGDDANLPEAMVITNSLTLQSGCTLNMDLDHYQFAGALTNDVIQGMASVTYGGTLNLSVTSIETNSVFKLFSAGSYNGAFESISPALPPLFPAVWAWDTSRLTVDGTLRITNLRPSISSISISGTDLTISGLNGIPGSDFYLLTSTNVALPLSQWTSIATNNFGGGGNFQFTFSAVVDPAATQQFFLLQIP
jgi:fibronectin-binding autotransporter adhesin